MLRRRVLLSVVAITVALVKRLERGYGLGPREEVREVIQLKRKPQEYEHGLRASALPPEGLREGRFDEGFPRSKKERYMPKISPPRDR